MWEFQLNSLVSFLLCIWRLTRDRLMVSFSRHLGVSLNGKLVCVFIIAETGCISSSLIDEMSSKYINDITEVCFSYDLLLDMYFFSKLNLLIGFSDPLKCLYIWSGIVTKFISQQINNNLKCNWNFQFERWTKLNWFDLPNKRIM